MLRVIFLGNFSYIFSNVSFDTDTSNGQQARHNAYVVVTGLIETPRDDISPMMSWLIIIIIIIIIVVVVVFTIVIIVAAWLRRLRRRRSQQLS